MAADKPLVLINGLIAQMPVGDTLDDLSLDVIMTSGDPNAPEILFDQDGTIMFHMP